MSRCIIIRGLLSFNFFALFNSRTLFYYISYSNFETGQPYYLLSCKSRGINLYFVVGTGLNITVDLLMNVTALRCI
jgi:hypothetical protein